MSPNTHTAVVLDCPHGRIAKLPISPLYPPFLSNTLLYPPLKSLEGRTGTGCINRLNSASLAETITDSLLLRSDADQTPINLPAARSVMTWAKRREFPDNFRARSGGGFDRRSMRAKGNS
jgi:hypothetical protein